MTAALVLFSAASPVRAETEREAEQAKAMLKRLSTGFTKVAKDASPAVVFIESERKVEVGRMPFRFRGPSPFGEEDPFEEFFRRGPRGEERQSPRRFERQKAQGSGFIVSEDGHVLTNSHVVNEADRLTVKLSDGRSFQAETIGVDQRTDLAVIRIEGEKLPTLPLGDSSNLEVGEWVLAIGNPFGLQSTVTAGIVSAVGRSDVGIVAYEDFIQTDCAINPGNSGGPLLNLDGRVVGINTAILSRTGGNMGIGFAIPVNMAKRIMNQLIDKGEVTRGYLGVLPQDLDPALAQGLGLGQTRGVLLSQVLQDTPAAKAGLQAGDVVVGLDGEKVMSASRFRNQVAAKSPGTTVRLTIVRNGKRQEVPVTLGTLPTADELTNGGPEQQSQSTERRLGLQVQELTGELAERLGYAGETGVLVSGVEPNSPAADQGVRSGALILAVDQQKVESLQDFRRAVRESLEDGSVVLHIKEGEYARYVVLRADE
jgi:serine protease Do